MDFSKLSANQQLTIGAAGAMFIIAFLPWFGRRGVLSISGWSSGFSAVIGIVLIVAAATILLMEAMDRAPVDSPAEIAFYVAAAGFALIVYRFIFGWGPGRRFGLFLGLLAAAVAAWGSFQNRMDNS